MDLVARDDRVGGWSAGAMNRFAAEEAFVKPLHMG